MTQKALATELHMCQNAISRYETGGVERRQARYAELIRIANYFRVSVAYLLERIGGPRM